MNINLKTSLFVQDPMMGCPFIDCLQIRKGTTFEYEDVSITYSDLTDNLEQVTFMLKQCGEVHWYDMLEYFRVLTAEDAWDADEVYYEGRADAEGDFGWVFTEVEVHEGDPIQGLYVLCSPADDEADLSKKQFDEHFYVDKNSGSIYFHLNPEETDAFECTDFEEPETFVNFQIAFRRNENTKKRMHGRDFVEVDEELPTFVVTDTSYSKIYWLKEAKKASNQTFASDRTIVNN